MALNTVKINRFIWDQTSEELKAKILNRASFDISEQIKLIQPVCEGVRNNGDQAILDYTEKFDRVKLDKEKIAVSFEEFSEAERLLDDEMKEVIQYAARNIRRFHEAQKPEPMWMMEMEKGVMAGEKVTPISDVACYVPGGKGSFPSVLLMLGTPATVAGVEKIIVITPPNKEGKVDPAILYAAKILGIHDVYKVGGAQSIAAVAFGTETIPKCSKVIGPGSSFVTAAKLHLREYIDSGVPAGPSESIILTDEHADPKKAALDLLIEAEHGPDSAALLVTHSQEVADQVEEQVHLLIDSLNSEIRKQFVETVLTNYGGIIVTNNLHESIDFANDYAPEHIELMVEQPFELLNEIKNAGEILLGDYSATSLFNFVVGPNHTLPTGQYAKTISAVSIHDFLKRSSIGYVTKSGFDTIKNYAAKFADIEGFETHAKALRERN
ncbi:histidinol dehydrogenase [Terrilactibacillus sp. BCM23-1]|uniref:Histidinol dehydrogenase n=1 Tax=Terrilactibacillus tamarindi TaxID=2599694 RepID=A0A6N8CPY2_9BACI|nr:histidinol dehydrogenase [Terrilactibacillus tamarindi]MTT31153.1 histidinol dehydrogenase [Terrilactibacillus tamarindi]